MRALSYIVVVSAVNAAQLCSGAAQTVQHEKLPPEVPANYRHLIIDEMKRALTVQSHIANAQISVPEVTWGGVIKPLGKIATVCVTYTATDFGTILGVPVPKAWLFYFADGKLAGSQGVAGQLHYARWCEGHAFSRFAEFDGVR